MIKIVRIQLTINDKDWNEEIKNGEDTRSLLFNIEQQLGRNMNWLIRKVDLVDKAEVIELED